MNDKRPTKRRQGEVELHDRHGNVIVGPAIEVAKLSLCLADADAAKSSKKPQAG